MKVALVLGGVVLAVLILAGAGGGYYYFYGPCGTAKVRQAGEELGDAMGRFGDAVILAGSTGRGALSGPVADLQEIAQETDSLVVPACLEKAKFSMVKGMESGVMAFILFMDADTSQVLVDAQMDISGGHFERATDELAKVRECAPFCD